MTRIRATCPSCGEVDLRPDDIRLHVVRSGAAADAIGEGSNYTFSCPGCAEEVVKPADERVARLLATGGVSVSVLPTNGHPESPPDGRPFTHDDLLDLHLLLAREDWFDDLVARCR